jgi:hypothetical protein
MPFSSASLVIAAPSRMAHGVGHVEHDLALELSGMVAADLR